jgi:hypothetical protein
MGCRAGERLVDLDGQVDPVERELTVAKRVGHVRVHLGHDQAAGGPDPFDRRREDVDLDPERDLAGPGYGGVDEHGVDRAHRVEEPWYE